jgi:ATP-dependent DNA ligase
VLKLGGIESRKSAFVKLLRRAHSGIVFDQHYEAYDETLFRSACRFSCEIVISKRFGSPYCSTGLNNG